MSSPGSAQSRARKHQPAVHPAPTASHRPVEPCREPLASAGRVGDVTELKDYYQQAYPRLVAFLVAVHGDREAAEEAAQEAFIKLMHHWQKVSHYENPDAWLRRVAINASTSQWRRNRNRRRAHTTSDRLRGQEWTCRSVDTDTRLVMHNLPLRQREVLVLHYWLDMPVSAIAAELRIAEGTVKSRLARARSALASNLMGSDTYGQH